MRRLPIEGRSASRCRAAQWRRRSFRRSRGWPLTGRASTSSGLTSGPYRPTFRLQLRPRITAVADARPGASIAHSSSTRRETDLDQAARMASEELLAIVGDPPCLDVALVGVGEDGHVASLFPGRELPPPRSASPDRRSLGEGGQPCPEVLVAAVYDSPKPPRRRLTFTMRVLCGAERVIVATLGRSKASVVRDALEEKDCTTPLAELLRRAQSSLVLLEKTD